MEHIKVKRVERKNGTGAMRPVEDCVITLSDIAILLDSNQTEIGRFTVDEAFKNFELVRFSKSGDSNFNVTCRDGQILNFVVWPKALKKLQAFANGAEMASSDDNINSLKKKGWVGLVVAFLGASLDLYIGMTGANIKYLLAGVVAILLGLFMSGYYFRMAKQLSKS